MLAAACSSSPAASDTADPDEQASTGQSSESATDSGESGDTKIAPAPGSFAPTGLMNDDRNLHAVVLLADGRVMAVGGGGRGGAHTSNIHQTAEIFDPSSGTWTRTANMVYERRNTALALLSNGSVLAVGGGDIHLDPQKDTDIWDPATGEWSKTGKMMTFDRALHRLATLPDGRVMVIGCRSLTVAQLDTVEIYDPATGEWTEAAPMSVGRINFTVTFLLDDRVLVAGGRNLESSEIYDSETGACTAGPAMTDSRHRYGATALGDGAVLFVGGETSDGSSSATEIYSPQ
jgi:N-acetylneuraminic acid mutarotase